MADVDVNIYQSVTNKEGVSTPVLGVIVGDPLPNPLNPTTGNEYTAGIGLSLNNKEFKLGDDLNVFYNKEDLVNEFILSLERINNHKATFGVSSTDFGSSVNSSASSNEGLQKSSLLNLIRFKELYSSINLKLTNNTDFKTLGFEIKDSDTADPSYFKAIDSVNLKGIEYDADYSANYTNRSLVDKEYVDGLAGGIPPIDGSYASQVAMIADQSNQTAQYIYFDGTAYWEYLGTVLGTIADYRQISGGGSDTNKVSYNVSDGKTASEEQQARDNIGLDTGIPYIETTDANLNNYVRNSNLIVFEGATAIRQIFGMVAGLDGEKVTLWNRRSFNVLIINDATATAANRFLIGSSYTLQPNQRITFVYNSVAQRWIYDFDVINRYFRRDVADTRNGTFTQSDSRIDILGTGVSVSFAVLRCARNSVIFFETNEDEPVRVLSGGVLTTRILKNGQVNHPRSTGDIYSIRRDEKYLNTFENITTVGAINNQAISAGIFAQRFTAATSLTGHANGENGRELTIFNNSGGTLTLTHESASSTATNRYYLIGAANIVMPDRGIVTLIYTANSRWELKSKNF